MECRCRKCTSACRNVPGLFMPDEATKAVEAGLANRMMAVAHSDHRGDYRALSPLSIPARGVCHPHSRMEPAAAHGRCTFLTADSACEIHDSGFKPRECVAAMLCRRESIPAHDIALSAWATTEGRRVVKMWARACQLMEPNA